MTNHTTTTHTIETLLPPRVREEAIRSHVLAQMLDLKRRLEPYEQKYKMSFSRFKRKVESLKEENFEMWDDFIVWEGLNDAYQSWKKRFESIK
jgi:hypothetical protein